MRTRYRYNEAPKAKPQECLFVTGTVRAMMDHKRGEIVIETSKDHPDGYGVEIARLPQARMAEARAIVALSDLIRTAKPFAALGRKVAESEPETPLLKGAADFLITVQDAQEITAAYDKALGPVATFQGVSGYVRAARPKP